MSSVRLRRTSGGTFLAFSQMKVMKETNILTVSKLNYEFDNNLIIVHE